MDASELYLKTIFCCMACDGYIATEEVKLLNSIVKESGLFGGLDVKTILDEYVNDINKDGRAFLIGYLKEVSETKLSEEQTLILISLAIKTIEADNEIEYSEVNFFKKIRKRLDISNDKIIEAFPDKFDYLLPDIDLIENFEWYTTFNDISINFCQE